MKCGIFYSMAGSWAVALRDIGIPIAWHICAKEFHKPFALNFPEVPLFAPYPSNLELVDMIVGSPPCVGMSIGNRKFEGNESEARPEHDANRITIDFARTVSNFMPKAFIMEMVPAFMSDKFKSLFDEYMALLADYNVKADVINFADYGVPQTRKRAIIIGLRKDLGKLPVFPLPFTTEKNERTTVRQAFAGLPTLTEDEAVAQKLTRKFNPLWKGPRSKYLLTKHKLKLDWDSPSWTVSALDTVYFKHPESIRLITWREAARLQEFPDDFRFEGGFAKCVKHAAWGVPCKGISHFIAAAISEILEFEGE